MIILALDTAGADCSVALYDAEKDIVLARNGETLGKGHAERLMGMIDEVLAQARIQPNAVGKVVVTIGPGSFTGIRVGVAAARGFGLALGIPVVGVTTLEVLAAAHKSDDARHVLTTIDAKRGEVYAQLFSSQGAAEGEPQSLTIEDAAFLAKQVNALVTGSGACLIDPSLPAQSDQFDISLIAKLGAYRSNASGKPAPLYLRGPDAKPQAGFAIKRKG